MQNDAQKNPQTPAKKDESLFSATVRVLGTPIKMVCDPIAQVCYPILEEHWLERYRKPWPDRFARRMLILDVALLTTIATLIVTTMIFFLLAPLFPLPALVNVEVLSPKTLVSGEPTEYDVAYRNDSDRLLGCAVLRLRLPAGTAILGQLPETGSRRTSCLAPGQEAGQATLESSGPEGPTLFYPLGNIAPHGRDLVRVLAKTYGPTGGLKVLTAEISYWEEAETAPTRVSARSEWHVDHAVLTLDAAAPGNGRGPRTVSFDYANASKEKIGPIVFRLRMPDDFILTGSSLPQTAEAVWTLGALDAGARGTLWINGYFKNAAIMRPPVSFALAAYAQENGAEYLLEDLRRDIDPKTTGFSLTSEVLSPGRDALLPGDAVKVAVRYRNEGARPLTDMTVRLIADPRFTAAVSPARLIWDKTNAPELADIAPGAEGTLTAEFGVVRDISRDTLGADDRPVLHLSSVATFALAEAPADRLTVDSTAIDLPIATRIGVQAAGLFFTKDGDQLGVGPLPPKVGQATKYRIFLDVTSTSGAADGVMLDAALPPNIQWTGRYSVNAGQAIDWLPSIRTVRWNIGAVPAYADSEGERLGASFEIALTPQAKDVGTAPTLVSGIELRGKDKATGLALHATAEPVTTDLPFDKRAAGKGTVVK